MSTVLVMSPADADWPTWLPLLLPRSVLIDEDARGACDAVVVINDHSAVAVALVRRALGLRNDRPHLPVAVLTPMQGHGLGTVVRGLSADAAPLPTPQMLAAVAAEAPAAEVRISDQVISFEFDA